MASSVNIHLRKASLEDIPLLLGLYKSVSQIEGRLARTFDEITFGYVENFTRNALEKGVQWVAINQENGEIIGEIHCYQLVPKVFSHVLSELTISVRPAFQGHGIGRHLFENLLEEVRDEKPEVLRIELIARESNQKAIAFYQSLGFEIEGKLRSRIQSVDGTFEADIPMAWLRT